jgi:cysteine-rich repeat protein
VALSSTRIAALVSEAGQGPAGIDLNGDQDTADRVLFVRAVGDPAPAECFPSNWVNTGLAGDALAVSGDAVVVAVPEVDQGDADLNGDGDAEDRVLRIWIYLADQQPPRVLPVGPTQALEDFVVGAGLVAFRTRECAQGGAVVSAECPAGGTNLNGGPDPEDDVDADDDVLQVFDFSAAAGPDGLLYNSGSAVTPCGLLACDSRFPYRFKGDTVVYLTKEEDQGGRDLNRNGITNEILKQSYNPRAATPAAQASTQGAMLLAPAQSAAGATGSVTPIASASLGVCTTTGAACAADSDCGAGRCYVPPGSCIRDLGGGAPCTCSPLGRTCSGCQDEQFCLIPAGGGVSGTCHEFVERAPGVSSCATQADCTTGGECTDVGADLQRLLAPIATATASGDEVVVSSGRCVRACSDDDGSDCDPADTCMAGICGHATGPSLIHDERGACRTEVDCEGGYSCTAQIAGKNQLVTVAAADSDGDALVDPLDNCPAKANVDQADLDQDGIGDACDLATCSDGVQAYQEGCDDGNLVPGDGCDASCRHEGIACGDGHDDDGDGLTDYPQDSGCANASDTSERGPSRQCDDGLDNDGDGLVDYPSDPGCALAIGIEAPACNDGLDNDGDGKIDYDGGPGGGTPDPECLGRPAQNRERPKLCGLGFELPLLLLPLLWWRGHRRRPGCSIPVRERATGGASA